MNTNATAGSPSAQAERTGGAVQIAALVVCAAATWLAPPAPAAETLKPSDVFDLQWTADPQIAPDGRSVAYVRMRMDIKTDRESGAIWLTGIDGKHARPLSGAASSSMPRWSPDGARIAYLAPASGSTQLFIHWADSNVSAPISHFTESPQNLAWSPDGRWLGFTMAVPAEHKPLKVDLPQAPKGASWAEPPKIIDRSCIRIDGEGYCRKATVSCSSSPPTAAPPGNSRTAISITRVLRLSARTARASTSRPIAARMRTTSRSTAKSIVWTSATARCRAHRSPRSG